MARLHEHQGKQLLERAGLSIPRGGVARSGDEAAGVAAGVLKQQSPPGLGVVVKVQAWTTGRAAAGGVAFAKTPAEASVLAQRMLAMRFGQFPVTEVLVEERIEIARELFVSFAVDERARAPVILLSASGGSGVEDRAASTHRVPCHAIDGPDPAALKKVVGTLGLDEAVAKGVEEAIKLVFTVARGIEARSLEINPLAITKDGRIVAADCRVTVDDYAVGRHPELGIEIARELDHPPTELERIAYRVEQSDHRGTFFFAQMNTKETATTAGKMLVGFHGAGGGGSMMSMDAITNEGFLVANFCDASGNPPPAKVYRAARIILQQPGLVGYFGSGSGVANQEQFWSAYGLAKAFWEMNLDIPAVIRLGGNTEDRAVDILKSACSGLPGKVEGYKKTDSPASVAGRMRTLVAQQGSAGWVPRAPRKPAFVGAPGSIRFAVKDGTVWIDPVAWKASGPAIVARSGGLLQDNHGVPSITLSPTDFMAKDSEMIACEVECRRDGIEGLFVQIDLAGLDAMAAGKAGA
ncbi:MAG: ATP-grasp domain-containing protein [Planctomycetota bacterium]